MSKKKLSSALLGNARTLRKQMTIPEDIMWKLLRNRKFLGLKFRREHPVREGHILDFYCHEAKLDVEIDGGYHIKREQREYDKAREETLSALGINVIRFTNDEVVNNIEHVLERLKIAVCARLQVPSSPSLLPEGEGRVTTEL